MFSTFCDSAFVHDDDLVAVPDRAQTVRDDQAGTASPADGLADPVFCHRIQCRGRFIKNQDRCFTGQRPRKFQPLPLSAGQIIAEFADRNVQYGPRSASS